MMSVKPVYGLYADTTTSSCHLPYQLPHSPPASPKYRPPACSPVQVIETSPSRCQVPQCRIVSCRLVSHAHFRQTKRQKSRELSCRHELNHKQRIKLNRSRIYSEGGLSNPSLGEPLHRFFKDMFEPAPHNFRQAFGTIVPAYRFNALTPVLSSEPFCIALTLLACTNNAIAHQYFVEVRTAMVLYTRALAGFRTMLLTIQNSHNPDQIELALVIISILLSYDALYAKFHELKLHREGMHQLVQLRGGLNCLTISLPYVVHFDRLSATMLSLSPAFSSANTPELRLHRLSSPTYGARFAQIRQQDYSPFSLSILEHCERTSNLIRLYESLYLEQKSESQNGSNKPHTDLDFFCSERDCIDEDFAKIHGSIFDDQSIDKCILWASRLVEYPVTWANYCPTYVGLLFEKLLESIQSPELRSQWSEQNDVLIWVLFVMTISLADFDGRSEVIMSLQELIGAKYGAQAWPGQWWEEELAALRGFVWCDDYFGQRYEALCMEIEGCSPT